LTAEFDGFNEINVKFKQDRQCTCNVTLPWVRGSAVEKQ